MPEEKESEGVFGWFLSMDEISEMTTGLYNSDNLTVISSKEVPQGKEKSKQEVYNFRELLSACQSSETSSHRKLDRFSGLSQEIQGPFSYLHAMYSHAAGFCERGANATAETIRRLKLPKFLTRHAPRFQNFQVLAAILNFLFLGRKRMAPLIQKYGC